MLYRAEVVTQWIEETTAEGQLERYPEVARAFPGHAMTVTDITHQQAEEIIPTPNAVTVEVICDGETLDLIEADPRFTVLPVTTEIPEDAETA